MYSVLSSSVPGCTVATLTGKAGGGALAGDDALCPEVSDRQTTKPPPNNRGINNNQSHLRLLRGVSNNVSGIFSPKSVGDSVNFMVDGEPLTKLTKNAAN